MSGSTSYAPISSPAVLEPTPLPTGTNAQDVSFLQQAWQGNTAEILEAQLAQSKGAEPATKQFGSWMVTDHGGVAGTLAALAQELGVTVPNSFTTAQSTEINRLQTLPGVAFDQNYAVDQVADHQQTLVLFQQEAANGQNPAVVAFAEQMIPVLQAHLSGAASLVQTTTGVTLSVPTPTSPTPLTSSGPAIGTPSAQDQTFVNTAAIANMAEVAQGRLAEAATGNPAGAQFGQWMVADHSAAEASLQTLAGQEGLSLPSGLDQANQQELSALQPLTDGSFFASYVFGQIIAHTQSLTAFIQEAQSGQDPAIRAYASTGISTLSGHLAGALTLAQSTPGVEASATAIDSALTNMLNSAAATGNAALLNDLTQIADIQPGFTYTAPKTTTAVGAAAPTPTPTMPLVALAH